VDTEVRIPKVGKTVSHWVLEALMILVSVGLAFGVAEYRDLRANHELARRVLRSLQTEVEQNLAALEPWTDYNRRFLDALAKADTSNSRQSTIDVYLAARPALPAGATLDTPTVRRGAWDAALSTGALRLIDYDVVAALSDIYQTQELFGTEAGRFSAEMHATTAYDPAMRIVGIRQASAELSEVAYAEKLLIDLYRRHLPAIRAAAGH
jgi:hypothetical protein